MVSFRPEVCLLLDCARTCLDAQRANRIKTLVSKDIEWAYLLRMAREHGVMPLLYRSFEFDMFGRRAQTDPRGTPRAFLRERWTQPVPGERTNQGAGSARALTKSPPSRTKDPRLAVSVYGNLAFREFGDLDILVRERDYQTAQHLLSAQGYRLTKEFDWESTLVHDSGTFAVDLHKGMTAREFSSPLNFEYLSGRLQRITVAGTEVPTLSPGRYTAHARHPDHQRRPAAVIFSWRRSAIWPNCCAHIRTSTCRRSCGKQEDWAASGCSCIVCAWQTIC